MKRAALLLLFCLTFLNTYAQTPTLLGVHGGSTPAIAKELGAQAVRYGFTDFQIKKVFLSGNEASTINKMKAFDSLGIKQVIFLRWPKDSVEVVGTNYERIPIGDDKVEVFQYLDKLLMAAGSYIDWIQINQEPLGATKYDHLSYNISEIIQWWTEVAQFIRAKQEEYPDELAHLKILTGGITGMKGIIQSPDSPLVPILDSIIKFGEDYCDAIDLHLHTPSLSEGLAEIEYISTRTNHPLTCTEWSQSKIAVNSGWLDDANTVWTDSSDVYFDISNSDVIYSAYQSPLSPPDWDSLIASSPFTPGFIPDFYEVLDENCFILACYAGVFQYGNPRFDWNQLLASKTVSQALYPNQPFYSEYINLSSELSMGTYESACLINNAGSKNNILSIIEIYPNPSSSKINITSNDLRKVLVFNQYGQLVSIHENLNGISNLEISLDQLSPSLYFVQITNSEGVTIRKVVKK